MLLGDGTELLYDVLVIATGAELLPEETEGMTGPGWGDSGVHVLHARRSDRPARRAAPVPTPAAWS